VATMGPQSHGLVTSTGTERDEPTRTHDALIWGGRRDFTAATPAHSPASLFGRQTTSTLVLLNRPGWHSGVRASACLETPGGRRAGGDTILRWRGEPAL
jgi:hypothetical protein